MQASPTRTLSQVRWPGRLQRSCRGVNRPCCRCHPRRCHRCQVGLGRVGGQGAVVVGVGASASSSGSQSPSPSMSVFPGRG
jgi:hypothetical protein